jgi:hypothetical protein
MSEKARITLFIVFLGCFMLWLILLVAAVLPVTINAIQNNSLDAVQGLIAGIGIGGITQFFIMALTLSWQFYWRKSKEEKIDGA